MDVTRVLQRLRLGDTRALNDLIPLVYEELKKLASSHLRRETKAGALETTVLVHEAFLKLAGNRHPAYENRSHFYGIASRVMRQILVDSARARFAEKRGAGMEIPVGKLPEAGTQTDRSLLVLHDALHQLQKADPQKARLIELRYFSGLTAEECSKLFSVPIHIVRRELRFAQAWLRREMIADHPGMTNTSGQTPSKRVAFQS